MSRYVHPSGHAGVGPPDVEHDGVCVRVATEGGPTCGAPARWHIVWTAEQPIAASLACDEHMRESVALFGAAQVHDATVECLIPGSWWVPGEARCAVPG